MFGYIEANAKTLNEEQLRRYRSAYCGLCRSLRERYGELCRLTLSYDMTFLVLLLNSMYEPDELCGMDCCLPHPFRARAWRRSRFTDYAADMSVAMAYFNLADDWDDEKNLLALGGTKLLHAAYEKVKSHRPEPCAALEEQLAELKEIERAALPDPDAAANCFGRLMGAVFTPEEDSVWSGRIRAFGEALGRFVYMMDACVDYEKDKRRGSYNPLRFMDNGELTEDEKLTILKILIGDCTAEFERLPLVRDVDLMRSVLYSGVWHRYAIKLQKEKRGADDQ